MKERAAVAGVLVPVPCMCSVKYILIVTFGSIKLVKMESRLDLKPGRYGNEPLKHTHTQMNSALVSMGTALLELSF